MPLVESIGAWPGAVLIRESGTAYLLVRIKRDGTVDDVAVGDDQTVGRNGKPRAVTMPLPDTRLDQANRRAVRFSHGGDDTGITIQRDFVDR